MVINTVESLEDEYVYIRQMPGIMMYAHAEVVSANVTIERELANAKEHERALNTRLYQTLGMTR